MTSKLINDTRLQDLLARTAEFGRQEGKGLNAKPSYALDVVAAAHDGVIGNDHAEQVWDAFSKGADKTKGHEKARLSTNKTDKVRISEARKLIACGTIAWPSAVTETPVDVMTRAINVINSNNDARGSTYQNMVKVARVQIEKRSAPLTDDEIKDAITPDAPARKDEQEQLTKHVKALKKMHDGDEKDPSVQAYPSPELMAAIKSLEARLANLLQAEELDQMFKTAAAMGMTITPPTPELVTAQ
jgi:hypothetical protein